MRAGLTEELVPDLVESLVRRPRPPVRAVGRAEVGLAEGLEVLQGVDVCVEVGAAVFLGLERVRG